MKYIVRIVAIVMGGLALIAVAALILTNNPTSINYQPQSRIVISTPSPTSQTIALEKSKCYSPISKLIWEAELKHLAYPAKAGQTYCFQDGDAFIAFVFINSQTDQCNLTYWENDINTSHTLTCPLEEECLLGQDFRIKCGKNKIGLPYNKNKWQPSYP